MLLNDMKVVSFCHVLQGPAATQYLGDMGADVIKVEPIAGERARNWAGMNIYPGGVSGFYLAAARNKRCLAIDLKSPEGKEIILSLVDQADAVVENFRSGVMARLGLSYEDLKQRKPDIIYASGTGWGRAGPMISRESQDLIIQARSGLMKATGTGRATPIGCAVVDQHGGALLAMGVVAAYVRKLRTGEGTHVESSLFGSGIDLQTEPLTVYMSRRPGRQVHDRDARLASWYHETPYGAYQLADAEIAVSSNDLTKLADALDSDALRGLVGIDRWAERDLYARTLADLLQQRSYAEVSAAFDKHGIWYSKVFDYEDLAEDPQAAAADAFREVDVNGERAVLVNHPIKYNGQTPELRTLPIRVGEHTREILGELGYDTAKIDGLIRRGVVAAPEPPAGEAELPELSAAS